MAIAVEKTVSEAIHYRRSVRIYDAEKTIEPSIVKQCIEQAVLAPTSSNMQLWEFYHITSKNMMAKIAPLCFNQNAAKTAQQLVVVVARKDLWKQRIKANLNHLNSVYGDTATSKQSNREKFAKNYYKKTMPFLYADFFGVLGVLKFIITQIGGLFKPMYRQVCQSDIRVVAHKSAGLAAENFMISMAAVGYDTCPMEGFDSLRVKRALELPSGAEINMIISCGIRKPEGVYGNRFRIPFDEVYKKV